MNEESERSEHFVNESKYFCKGSEQANFLLVVTKTVVLISGNPLIQAEN